MSALSVLASAARASAAPTRSTPVCAGAQHRVVNVTQDVRNQPLLPARDGRMWAKFSYTQHLRIWKAGPHLYCSRKDFRGTWKSIAGRSPGLTGTISAG